VAGIRIADVAFYHFEAGVSFEVGEVVAVPGGEVVEYAYGFGTLGQQVLCDVRANETRTARHQYLAAPQLAILRVLAAHRCTYCCS
jgi:hypothetical protein